MSVRWNGTVNGTPVAFNSSYAVIAKTSTAHKVNVTLQTGTIVAHSLALVLKNGSAVWTFTGGMNYTGSSARSAFLGIMGGFDLQVVFGNSQALAQLTSVMHSTGSSTVMIGPTSVMVTNYVPNTLPLSYNQCGVSGSFTRFDLQTGTVTGETLTLVTLFKVHGTFTGPGGTTTLDVTVRITSITKA